MIHNQKSTCFMLPWLDLSYPDLVAQGFETTYLGASYLESMDKNNYGKYLILQFKESNDFINNLKRHRNYDSIKEVDGKIHVIFKFTEEALAEISGKFIQGKYSEIDRGYVNKYFKSNSCLIREEDNVNYQILTKDPRLKAYWEYKLSIPEFHRYIQLSDTAEVWSIPEKKDEYYDFKIEEFPVVPQLQTVGI